jgi:putative ABC transport system permease protein
VTTLFLDLRYAIRGLRARPGVTTVAVATIALAIGANAAIFSFVDGLLLNPLPYPDSDRIVRVLERRPDGGVNGVSSLNYLDWAEENTVFEHIAAQSGWNATMTGGDEPVRMQGIQVSPAFFSIYGLTAALGRTFAPDEDRVGNDAVVVIGHSLWQSRFGGDTASARSC